MRQDILTTTAFTGLGQDLWKVPFSDITYTLHVSLSPLFAISATVLDDKISLLRYDSTGIICTPSEYSILSDFDTVAVIILLLARSAPQTLGALPVETGIHPPKCSAYPPTTLAGSTLVLPHPTKTGSVVEVTLREHVFSQYALCGRHTMVYRAEARSWDSERDLMVRLSFQPAGRTPEHHLVRRGIERGVQHLPEIHFTGKLWTLQDIRRKVITNTETDSPHPDPKFEDLELRAVLYPEYYPLEPLLSKHPTLIPEMAKQILACMYSQSFGLCGTLNVFQV